MSCAEWLSLDLNRETPAQEAGRSRRAPSGSLSTRNVDRRRREIWERSHPFQLGNLVTVVTAAQSAGSALGVNPVTDRAGRQYAWLRVGGPPASDSCARSVRPGRSDLRTRDHAEFPGTVDLAFSGADPSLRLNRSEGAI